MKRLSLIIDVDSTINRMIPAFMNAVVASGAQFDMQAWNSHATWEIENFILGADDPIALKSRIFNDLEFWETIPPVKEAIPVLEVINRYHDVTIATVPWGTSAEMKKVKRDWVTKHFPYIKGEQVTFNPDKWALGGEVIFDDKPATIEKCHNHMITVVPSEPYNRDVECDFRFTNWKQVPSIMKTILSNVNV